MFYLLGVILYAIGEGVTEGKTWNYVKQPTYPSISEQNKYHIFRFFIETIGIILMVKFYNSIGILFDIVTFIFAVSLYEMAFSTIVYKNPFYNKTSKWLGIPHPSGKLWGITFLVSGFYLIKVIF